MNGISQAFDGKKALITYITAGDPDLETTAFLLKLLDERGVDILEVGIPFSDPLADGPVIQQAGQRALKSGTTLKKLLAMLASLKEEVNAPLVLMGYMNSLMAYGLEAFAKDAAEAGVAGVIVPDLPFHQSEELAGQLRSRGVDFILMVTPNSTQERLSAIAEKASGFLYCVSLLGVTGNEEKGNAPVEEYIQRVRSCTKLPLALGFGVGTPERAKAAASVADGVIVGSALISLLEPCGADRKQIEEKATEFIGSLRAAVDSAG
jgi:tryptophan synthase alpha chain